MFTSPSPQGTQTRHNEHVMGPVSPVLSVMMIITYELTEPTGSWPPYEGR